MKKLISDYEDEKVDALIRKAVILFVQTFFV